MKKTFLIMAIVLFSCQLLLAAESTWKQLYGEAVKLAEEKKYSDAKKKAGESLAAAQKEFGPDSTPAGQVLGLMMMIEQLQGKTPNDPELKDLLARMMVIQSKVIEEKAAMFAMTWSLGDPAKEWPGMTHVILKFTGFPNHFIGIYSKDLGDYLQKLGRNPVNVVFKVKYDKSLKEISSYNEVDIGGLTRWQSPFGYGGREGDWKPSPWDQLIKDWEKNDQSPSPKSQTNPK